MTAQCGDEKTVWTVAQGCGSLISDAKREDIGAGKVVGLQPGVKYMLDADRGTDIKLIEITNCKPAEQ